MKLNSEFLNTVLFQEKIEKIKKEWFKKWLLSFCSLKNIIGRLATIILGSIIFCVIYFVLRQNGLEGAYGKPAFNQGSAFGSGSGWAVWTIYLIKALVSLLFFVSFFIFNKWYCYVPLWCVFINALCILIDKGMVIPDTYLPVNSSLRYDTVVDYFHFPTFVNNIGDIFIIVFACISVLTITVYLVRSEWFQDKEDKDEGLAVEVKHE